MRLKEIKKLSEKLFYKLTKNIKYWLEEKDLKTPEHDKMVLWTFNNVEKILRELGIEIPKEDWEKNCEKKLESPIIQERYNPSGYGSPRNAIGFVDLEVVFSSHNHESKYFFFEIKPHIYSIGDVMRQINYYKTYLNGKFIIVTKTKGLKKLFESQNVLVYEL